MLKKILVADDDPAIVDALQMLLEDQGYGVETTVDGNELKKLTAPYPNLILLDIWMSGIDGRDICSFLKGKVETQNIPIIMISANKDTVEIAHKCGAEDCITKPFELSELLEKVKKYWN